jgi:hypothetical protein
LRAVLARFSQQAEATLAVCGIRRVFRTPSGERISEFQIRILLEIPNLFTWQLSQCEVEYSELPFKLRKAAFSKLEAIMLFPDGSGLPFSEHLR